LGSRILVSLILGFILLVPAGLGSNQAFGHGSPGTPITGTLFFTSFNNLNSGNCGPGGVASVPADPCFGIGPGSFNVWKVGFSWDGSTLTFPGGITPVALTNGADGIVGLPNGNFAVAGQNSGLVHELTPAGVQVNGAGTASGVAQAYHLGLDPAGAFLYSAGIPNFVGKLAVPIVAAGAANGLAGPDTILTQIAWDGVGDPFYTSSAAGGFGTFGSLDVGITTTAQIFTLVAYPHGMDFDTFCSFMTLFGGLNIAQIATGAPVDPTGNGNGMLFTGPGGLGITYDQGVSDGTGILIAASNNGLVTLVDTEPGHTGVNVPCQIGAGQAGDPTGTNISHPTDTKFLIWDLDDVADIVLPPEEVGGNIIPIDTISFIVAGAQTSLAWLLPILISTVGIGIFISQSNKFTFFRRY